MDVMNARREPDDLASIDCHNDMMSLVAQELRHQSWIEGVVEHSRCDVVKNGPVTGIENPDL